MKHSFFDLWRQRLTGWLVPSHRPGTPPPGEASDWAHTSAVGEEDPGASVDLLDTRPPVQDTLRADRPHRS